MKQFAVLVAATALLLGSCTAQESYENAKSCAEVNVGMTQEQVRHLMGEPTGDDATTDGGHTWSYLFGGATDTQAIKVVFDNTGKVTGKECAPEAQGDKRPDSDANER